MSNPCNNICKCCRKPLTCEHIEQQVYFGCEHVQFRTCEECWDEQYSDEEYVQQKRRQKDNQENSRELKPLTAKVAG